jgi:hypothetical protein
MKVSVIFTHDDDARKWEVVVSGAADASEARQAFAAVVLTCQQLDSKLLMHTQVASNGDDFAITPAVRQ